MNNKKSLIIFSIIFIIFLSIVLFSIFTKSKNLPKSTNSWKILSWSIIKENDEKLVLTIIEDKRNPETKLDWFLENLKKQIPEIENSEIKKLDFSDTSVKSYMEKNSIKFLPAIIFSKYNLDEKNDNENTSIKNYLTKMDSWEYFLEIWAIYNPFIASDRWLHILDKNVLNDIKNDSFFENWNDKKIIWLEIWNLSCSFCQKFHNSWIIKEILNSFNWKISKTYNHIVINDWKHFETLECLAEQKWKDWFFKFLDIFYQDKVYKFEDLSLRLEKDWYDLKKLETCISEWKFLEKVEKQSNRIWNIFWVKSTPTSIFINSETWEYKIVSWFLEKLWKQPYIDAINKVK